MNLSCALLARVVAGSALALSACSADTRGLATPDSSSARLRPRAVRATDGEASRLLHFVDRRTGEACVLYPIGERPGATQRCRPAAVGHLAFLDAACTKRYLETTLPEHGWQTAVGGGPYVVRLGARVVPAGPHYLDDAGGGCFASESKAPLFEVAEVWEDAQLASGRLEAVPAGERLEAVVFRGDDGGTHVQQLRDVTTGVPCVAARTEAGDRCAPLAEPAMDAGYRDASCQRLMIGSYTDPAVAEVEGVVQRMALVPEGTPVARLSPDGTCAPFEWRYGGRERLYYATPYPASEWPALTFQERGGPRLYSRRLRFPTPELDALIDATAAEVVFEDRRLGADCSPAWIDGVLRCAPSRADSVQWYRPLYAEAGCVTPAIAVYPGREPPAAWLLPDGAGSPEQGNLPTGAVYEIAGELPASSVFQRFGTACSAVPAEPYRYFALRGPMPPERHAPLALALDP